LIKVIVAPLILGTLVTGIAAHGKPEKSRENRAEELDLFRGDYQRSRCFLGIGAINLTRGGRRCAACLHPWPIRRLQPAGGV